jgi:hypothetical protein
MTAFINSDWEMPRKRRSPEYRLAQDSQSREARQRVDPVSAVIQSGRPTGKQVETAYGYLNTCAKNARNNSELDDVRDADNLLFERLINTMWARKVKDAHRRISVAIRKRSNELRETESETKVGTSYPISRSKL